MLSPEEIVEAQKNLESEERHGHHKGKGLIEIFNSLLSLSLLLALAINYL